MALVASCRRLPASGSPSVAAVAGWIAFKQRAGISRPSSSESVVVEGCPFGHGSVPSSPPQASRKAIVKGFEQIPSPGGLLSTLPALVAFGGASRYHEYCDRRHRDLGPIYREHAEGEKVVFVSDPRMIEKVYQSEGKYPMHMVPKAWTIYNEAAGIQRGIFFKDGPLWSEQRNSLNKFFLKAQAITDHTHHFGAVSEDLLESWSSSRDDVDGTLPGLERQLYNWSIESLGMMIFGRRLGCVPQGSSRSSSDPPLGKRNIHEFVHSVQQIFTESARMTVISPRLAFRFRLPVWKRFTKAADTALQLAREYVLENMRSNGAATSGIPGLLLEAGFSVEDSVCIVTDLFLAAADTTSHATQWSLHLLAKNPESQTRLLEEVTAALEAGEQTGRPKGQDLGGDHLVHMPYLKAIIKESLRLYPVAPFLTRRLCTDIELEGYHIPSGTMVMMSVYTTGRDERNFSQPAQFMPERWLRKKGSRDVISSHACLPFGLGARSCIGRRVAEVQMQLLLAKAVQRFQLSSANEREVAIQMRMIATPSEPIRLRLTPRNNP